MLSINNVSFRGIKNDPTFLATGIEKGRDEWKPVKVSENKTVSLCSADEDFRGVVDTVDYDGGACGVKEYGYVTVTYSETAPELGESVGLVADGLGGVKASEHSKKKYPVVDVDTGNKTVTFKLLG